MTPTADPRSVDDAPTPSPGAPRGRRVGNVALVVAAVALGLTVGVVALRPERSAFCTRVVELPSVASLGDDGTPSDALASDATAFERLAEAAPDEPTAAAARAVAAHQRALSAAVSGSTSSTEVVGDVEELDLADLDDARERLDREIAQRCS